MERAEAWSRLVHALTEEPAGLLSGPIGIDELAEGLMEQGDAVYLSWKDDPELVQEGARSLAERRAPSLRQRDLPPTPDAWFPDEDELSPPLSLDLVAAMFDGPWAIVDIDRDGYVMCLCRSGDVRVAGEAAAVLGIPLDVHVGGVDVAAVYAAYEKRAAEQQ